MHLPARTEDAQAQALLIWVAEREGDAARVVPFQLGRPHHELLATLRQPEEPDLSRAGPLPSKPKEIVELVVHTDRQAVCAGFSEVVNLLV